MIDSWTVYWISRLDSITVVLHLFAFIFAIFAMLSIVFLLNEYAIWDSNMKECSSRIPKIVKLLPIIFLPIFVTLVALTPNTKDMCAVIIIPKIVNNEKLQDVGDKFYNLAIDWMEELSPKRKEVKNEKK